VRAGTKFALYCATLDHARAYLKMILVFVPTINYSDVNSPLIDLSFACSIGKSQGFAGFGDCAGVLSGRIRPENAVRMHSAQLDALLRLLKSRRSNA